MIYHTNLLIRLNSTNDSFNMAERFSIAWLPADVYRERQNVVFVCYNNYTLTNIAIRNAPQNTTNERTLTSSGLINKQCCES